MKRIPFSSKEIKSRHHLRMRLLATVVAAILVSESAGLRVSGFVDQPAHTLTRLLAHSSLAPGSRFEAYGDRPEIENGTGLRLVLKTSLFFAAAGLGYMLGVLPGEGVLVSLAAIGAGLPGGQAGDFGSSREIYGKKRGAFIRAFDKVVEWQGGYDAVRQAANNLGLTVLQVRLGIKEFSLGGIKSIAFKIRHNQGTGVCRIFKGEELKTAFNEAKSFGEQLRVMRNSNFLTQGELAEKLGLKIIGKNLITVWETDGSIPNEDNLLRLSEFFKVDISSWHLPQPSAKPEEETDSEVAGHTKEEYIEALIKGDWAEGGGPYASAGRLLKVNYNSVLKAVQKWSLREEPRLKAKFEWWEKGGLAAAKYADQRKGGVRRGSWQEEEVEEEPSVVTTLAAKAVRDRAVELYRGDPDAIYETIAGGMGFTLEELQDIAFEAGDLELPRERPDLKAPLMEILNSEKEYVLRALAYPGKWTIRGLTQGFHGIVWHLSSHTHSELKLAERLGYRHKKDLFIPHNLIKELGIIEEFCSEVKRRISTGHDPVYLAKSFGMFRLKFQRLLQKLGRPLSELEQEAQAIRERMIGHWFQKGDETGVYNLDELKNTVNNRLRLPKYKYRSYEDLIDGLGIAQQLGGRLKGIYEDGGTIALRRSLNSNDAMAVAIAKKVGIPIHRGVRAKRKGLLAQRPSVSAEAKEAFSRMLTEGEIEALVATFGLKGAYKILMRFNRRVFTSDELRDFMKGYVDSLDKARRKEVSTDAGMGLSFQRMRKVKFPDEFTDEDVRFMADEVIESAYPELVKDYRFLEMLLKESQTEDNSPLIREAYKAAHDYYKEVGGLNIDGLRKGTLTLKFFQRIGVHFLIKKKKAILADEPGLGKTIQVLLACMNINNGKGARKVLVIAPNSSLHKVWEHEITTKLFPQPKAVIISGTKQQRLEKLKEAKDARFVVVSYDAIRRKDSFVMKALREMEFDVVVVDEAHRMRNESLQTKAVRDFKAEHQFLITGTPVVGRKLSRAVSNLIVWLYPERFHNRDFVSDKYKGKAGPVKFYEDTRDFILRRRRAVVQREVPLERHVKHAVYLSPQEGAAYMEERRGILAKIEELKLISPGLSHGLYLTMYGRLAQAAIGPSKYKAARELVERAARRGEKVVIFTFYRHVAKHLAEELKDFGPVLFIGGMSKRQSEKALDDFEKNPKAGSFISTFKKGGESIPLTAASHVILVDKMWTNEENQQAVLRLVRYGQKNEVTVHHLIAKLRTEDECVDEHKEAVLQEGELVSKFALGEELPDLTDEIAERLLQELKVSKETLMPQKAVARKKKSEQAGRRLAKALGLKDKVKIEIEEAVSIKESVLWPMLTKCIPYLKDIDYHGKLEWELELARVVLSFLFDDETLAPADLKARLSKDVKEEDTLRALYILDRYNIFRECSTAGLLSSDFYYSGRALDYEHPLSAGMVYEKASYSDSEIVEAIVPKTEIPRGLASEVSAADMLKVEAQRYRNLSVDEEARLSREARKGNLAAVEAMSLANLNIVIEEAEKIYYGQIKRRNWRARQITLDDLIAEGAKELPDLMREFNEAPRAEGFDDFARPRIKRAISSFFWAQAKRLSKERALLNRPIGDEDGASFVDLLTDDDADTLEAKAPQVETDEAEYLRLRIAAILWKRDFSEAETDMFFSFADGLDFGTLASIYGGNAEEVEYKIERMRKAIAAELLKDEIGRETEYEEDERGETAVKAYDEAKTEKASKIIERKYGVIFNIQWLDEIMQWLIQETGHIDIESIKFELIKRYAVVLTMAEIEGLLIEHGLADKYKQFLVELVIAKNGKRKFVHKIAEYHWHMENLLSRYEEIPLQELAADLFEATGESVSFIVQYRLYEMFPEGSIVYKPKGSDRALFISQAMFRVLSRYHSKGKTESLLRCLLRRAHGAMPAPLPSPALRESP